MMRLSFLKAGLLCLAVVGTAAPARAADLDKFMPKETDLVISLNVRQLLDSQIVKKNALELIKTALASNKDVQKLIEAIGLDPLKDFNRISLAMGLEDVSNPKAIFVIDGRFDVKKIDDTMEMLVKSEPKVYAVDKVGGKTVYKVTTPNQPTPMFAAPIDGTVMAFASSKELLAGAFEAAAGTRQVVLKKEVADLLAKADAKSSMYIVAQTKGRLDAIPLPDPEMKKIIEQVVSITADVKIEKDVEIEFAIGTSTAEEAKKMRELVGGGLELAKVQVKVAIAQQPELQPIVDLVNSMAAVQKDKAVVINGKLPGTAIEKLFDKK